ncbi:MAG TPA: alkaline phosphatase family protein, partial [Solirubrobacterales bacterium]|nr:alkaline phosphatase family protein [Solirubrobacterales bacterium]
MSRSSLMILADGARAETFESLLASGELPQIREHVVERGSYRRGTSTFTSTTGPAHIPLLTGCFPGTVGVPGYRWFDRDAYRGWGPAAPHALRSYNRPEVAFLAKDMDQAQPTLYELIPDSVGVFGLMNRGLEKERNLRSREKPFIWSHSHWFHDYERADRWAGDAMVEAAALDSRFRFVAFPGIDWNCHYIGEDSPEATRSYKGIDEAVGKAAQALIRKGTYDETMITIVSDHGHRRIHTHFDLAVEIGRVHGIKTAYHSWPAFRPSFDGVVCVSGNGMAHIYLKGEDGTWRTRPSRETIRARHAGLLEWLVATPAVDIVTTRGDAEGELVVESRRGVADLRETRADGWIRYAVRDGADPFGFCALPGEMSSREALETTAETEYPDALAQIAQLFRTGRTGDIVVSATPGFDLRERFEWPEHVSSHGGLIRDHMLVPFASSVPLQEGPVRTADIATTVLDYLGVSAPPGVDG